MNVVYPGSFDPVTEGHVNIARRSARMFGNVTVAVLDNLHKKSLFTVEEKLALLREVFAKDSNIKVEAFSGLLVEYVSKKNMQAIIRGVRGPEDLSKELPYAIWNRQLSEEKIETIYLPAEPALAHISGSIVKEVAAHIYENELNDKILLPMAPTAVLTALREKYEKKRG